jgi:transposase
LTDLNEVIFLNKEKTMKARNIFDWLFHFKSNYSLPDQFLKVYTEIQKSEATTETLEVGKYVRNKAETARNHVLLRH